MKRGEETTVDGELQTNQRGVDEEFVVAMYDSVRALAAGFNNLADRVDELEAALSSLESTLEEMEK